MKISKDEKGNTQIQRTVYVKNRVLREDGSYKPVTAGTKYVQETHTFLHNWAGGNAIYWSKKHKERSQEKVKEQQRHH